MSTSRGVCASHIRCRRQVARVGVAGQQVDLAADTSAVCPHEYGENVLPHVKVEDGQTLYMDIRKNQMHRYVYENYNITTMNQDVKYRKLMIMLEPCKGVVYLFVRKTRPCWPNPYSCIDIETGARDPDACEWTHFMSTIDGSRDGAPTYYEVPLTSTRWFISVFATETASYTLTLLADIGALARPGGQGVVSGSQKGELKVQLDWKQAFFRPQGVSEVKRYWVYSSMLLDQDDRTNTHVFLRPNKILNTVCGLHNNTDREYHIVDPSSCDDEASGGTGMCSVNITGVMTQKRYVFNVIVESQRGFAMAYSGLIMETNWQVYTKAASEQTLHVIGAVCGTVVGIVIIGYLWLVKVYH